MSKLKEQGNSAWHAWHFSDALICLQDLFPLEIWLKVLSILSLTGRTASEKWPQSDTGFCVYWFDFHSAQQQTRVVYVLLSGSKTLMWVLCISGKLVKYSFVGKDKDCKKIVKYRLITMFTKKLNVCIGWENVDPKATFRSHWAYKDSYHMFVAICVPECFPVLKLNEIIVGNPNRKMCLGERGSDILIDHFTIW